MESNTENGHADFSKTGRAVEKAFQSAVRDALIDHKLRGLPVVGAENGKVKWIPAEEIVIPPEEPTRKTPS